MSFLRDFSPKQSLPTGELESSELFSIYYHNIFDYPLTFSELVKWVAKDPPKIKVDVEYGNGFYYVTGKEGLIYKRAKRERYSQKKIQIAKKASRVMSLIPGIKMIGLTGSLAMENADRSSDIDMIIITKKGKLWTTRLLTYALLKIMNFRVRKPGRSQEKDKLCLNIWLDESDLAWKNKDKNFYTAHEILQIVPLVDKEGTYKKLLSKNRWVLGYWPSVKEIRKVNSTSYTKQRKLNLIETLAFRIQYAYMRPKMTRETVSPTRAIFHPNDLGREITGRWPLTVLP